MGHLPIGHSRDRPLSNRSGRRALGARSFVGSYRQCQTGSVSTFADPHALLDEVDRLVGDWLTLPDAADELGIDISAVRRLLTDQVLVAVRRGRPSVLSIPAALVRPEPLAAFPGTWTVLRDCGYDDLEALRWLFTDDQGASPVGLLRAGHKTEVRRRAQALAL